MPAILTMMNSSPSGYSNTPSAAFDMLAEPVRRWVWDKGWGELRDVQERAISTLLGGERDLIIAAPTAGGKTEAAFLPLVSSMLEAPGTGGFDLLYVAPLKALINDQLGRMEDLCKQTDIPVYPWHGDISQGVKSRARANPKGVLLITPESLEAMFVLRGLQVPTLFQGTRCVIIDELHALLDNERGIHLRSLLNRLEQAVGRGIRRVGLSATLSDMEMVKEYLRPGSPGSVDLLEGGTGGGELRLQIRGYTEGGDDDDDDEDDERDGARQDVAKHLFSPFEREAEPGFRRLTTERGMVCGCPEGNVREGGSAGRLPAASRQSFPGAPDAAGGGPQDPAQDYGRMHVHPGTGHRHRRH